MRTPLCIGGLCAAALLSGCITNAGDEAQLEEPAPTLIEQVFFNPLVTPAAAPASEPAAAAIDAPPQPAPADAPVEQAAAPAGVVTVSLPAGAVPTAPAPSEPPVIDGVVVTLEYVQFLIENWATAGGDVNGDGVTDQADLGYVLAYFGLTLPK